MPTKNRLGLLQRAVAGLQSQTYTDWECVIVDDASSDDTPSYMRRLTAEDSRFRYIRNETSIGACACRNAAIESARTRYVTGIDDDDMFMPDRLETLLATITPAHSLVSANDIIVGGRWGAWVTARPSASTFSAILRRNCVGNQALFLRDHALEIGGFDIGLKSSQDYDFWIRMIEKFGPGHCIARPSQIIFAENTRQRITNSQLLRRGESERRILDKFRDRMSLVQRLAHNAKILSREGQYRALAFSLLAFDFTRAGAMEVIDTARSIRGHHAEMKRDDG
jgi:glycosyltransferase involved in cell wall biosynthesis